MAHLSNEHGALAVPIAGHSIAHVLSSLMELWPGYTINSVMEEGEW